MSNPSRAWTDGETRILEEAIKGGKGAAEIQHLLPRRTYGSINDKMRRMGVCGPAIIRELWGKEPVSLIAQRCNLSRKTVGKLAAEMGLPPAPAHLATPMACAPSIVTPKKPKGYTAKQLAEAKATPSDPQSRLMLIHHYDRAVMRQVGIQ